MSTQASCSGSINRAPYPSGSPVAAPRRTARPRRAPPPPRRSRPHPDPEPGGCRVAARATARADPRSLKTPSPRSGAEPAAEPIPPIPCIGRARSAPKLDRRGRTRGGEACTRSTQSGVGGGAEAVSRPRTTTASCAGRQDRQHSQSGSRRSSPSREKDIGRPTGRRCRRMREEAGPPATRQRRLARTSESRCRH